MNLRRSSRIFIGFVAEPIASICRDTWTVFINIKTMTRLPIRCIFKIFVITSKEKPKSFLRLVINEENS